MKITVQTNDLKKAVNLVSRGVGLRPQMPILSGILLKVFEGEVSLTSTDLEISFWTRLPAQIDEDGEIIVPAKLFSDLVSSLPSGNVSLLLKETVLVVETKGIEAEIVGQSTEDFPVIPRASKAQVSLSGGEYRQKIERVCICAARDDARPVLMGVLWEIKEGEVVMAATDGYRLSVDSLKVGKSSWENSVKFILPASSLQEVSKVLSENGEGVLEVEFEKENQQVIFKIGSVEVTSRLIVGEFPPYQQIMPNTYSTRSIFNKSDLFDAVKRASLFAKEGSNIIKVSVGGGLIVVKAEGGQIGSNVTKMEVEMEGEEIETSFNARYLLDYLNVCEDEKVVWETEGELKPSVFKSEEEGWIQVVMPIRVQ